MVYNSPFVVKTNGEIPISKGVLLNIMKATGIVRRIDDLGRVVIPKEIRRTLHIKESDPLEIFTDKDGAVIFKKYSPMGELSDFAAQICESLHKTTACISAVCDRDSVLTVAGGGKRELQEKTISAELEQMLESRRLYQFEQGQTAIPVLAGDDKYTVAVAAPILSEGDVLGGVLFLTEKGGAPVGEVEVKLAQTVSMFLGKQMES